MKLVALCLIVIYIRKISCEFYSSIDKLQEVFDYESEILHELVEVLNRFNEIEDFLRYKITPWNDEHVAAEKNVEKYVTNPLNAFLLLKRSVYDVEMLQDKLKLFTNDLSVRLQSLREKNFIEKREVSGAVAGVLRAQHAYHLESTDLTEGIIDGERTREPLTLHDIYVIANESYFLPENDYFAKSYFTILKEKLEINYKNIHNGVNETEIEERLDTLKGKTIENPFEQTFNVTDLGQNYADRILTQKVCRLNLTRSARETKNLRCKFVSFSAFSSIAPFKLEELSIDPHIVIYYEVIFDSEINKAIEIARRLQQKAGIYIDTPFEVEDYRLAQSAWLKDGQHQVLNRLNERFEDMTGLTMETAEPLQVQNYGVGGYFCEHYDHSQGRNDSTSRERIATLMLYVNL